MTEKNHGSALSRASVAAGVAVPALLLVAVTVLGFLEPGYSHRTQPMSILGGVVGLRGFAFNATVTTGGALIALFTFGFVRARPPGKLAVAGLALLFIGAAGMSFAGFFHCDEQCTNVFKAPTAIGRLHIIASFLAGMGLGLAPLFFVAPMRKDPRWRSMAKSTLIFGVLSNAPGITMWITLATVRLPEWEGLLQRLGIVFSLVWIAAVAWRLRSMRAERNVESFAR